jgi:hypothetical protein
MKTSATSFAPRAQNIAAENNLYPAWLEQLWQVYESALPNVADQLERRRVLTDDDTVCLMMHVAALTLLIQAGRPKSTTGDAVVCAAELSRRRH